MAKMDNTFLLQTKGYCLSCLRKNKSGIKSMQRAINYLKVDVKQIFSRAFGVNTELIREVDLQGTLCEKCGERLDKFVKIKREMERLKVELDSCLRSINEEMRRSEDDGVLDKFKSEMKNSSGTSFCLKLVKMLRVEMINGCSQSNVTPASNKIADDKKEVKPSLGNVKRSKAKRIILIATISKKKFACKLCSRRFSHKLLLVRHRKMSHPELHLQCDMCPAIYYFTETLKRHKLTIHSANEASYPISSSQLELETSKHQACRKMIKRKQKSFKNIQQDVRTDYDIRPRTHRPNYNIDYSLKQLDSNEMTSTPLSSKRSKLIINLNTNNDSKSPQVQKPFKCDHCPKTYTKRVRKLDHERVVHQGILFQCDGCEKKFRMRNSLRNHRNNVHRNKAGRY